MDIQQYFRDCCTVTENIIRLGNAQLQRDDYLQIKKLLESRDGKWKGGKTNGFVFESDASAIYKSICKGDTENKKNMYQFFPTPDDVADRMVKMLDIDPTGLTMDQSGAHILEPSAGRGALIAAVHKVYPDLTVDAYEINPDCFYALEQIENVRLHREDFIECPDELRYDYIIANPPFAKNADIKHFRKMYSVLKYGGRMTVILSSHALEAREREVSEFKKWLYSLHPVVAELSAGTFKSAGTYVRTYIVTLQK